MTMFFPSLFSSALSALFRREVSLLLKGYADMALAVFMFLVVVTLFPFALGGEVALLKATAAGILWVAVLLAALLTIDVVFQRDIDDGTLEALWLSGQSLPGVFAVKAAVMFMLCGVPLLLAAAVVAPALGVPVDALPVLLLSLAMGVFYLSFLGGFGAALTAGSLRPAVLLIVIVLPLYVPMFVLGTLAATAALEGLAARPYVLLQAALLVFWAPLSVYLSGAAALAHMRSS